MMFKKTKTLKGVIFKRNQQINLKETEHVRSYIHDYWPKITRYHPTPDDNLLALPEPYIVPASEEGHEFDFNEMYYWDSYFIIQGLLDNEHKKLVMGILENLLTLFREFKIIPNASRTYLTGRSQPPFLTSFILDIYNAYDLDIDWLKEHMAVAEDEYKTVWIGTVKPNSRKVYKGLSRYFDINYIDDLAEAESGWDMTTRFNRKALNYLPVDLNSLLYKYETDFSHFYDLIGDQRASVEWKVLANRRRDTMNKLMWSNLHGMYFDFNFAKEKRGTVSSLAAFYPLWVGLADDQQAKVLVKSLRRFEHKGGLATTEVLPLNQYVPGSTPTQWAYPNGWAPLQFLVVNGLERYGYHEDAKRIALKWLKTNLDWFNVHKVFLEKYNVVAPDKPPAKGLYPSQTGFGWTNAVFERFCKDYLDNPTA
jgi:alpha,alpha-trehalase